MLAGKNLAKMSRITKQIAEAVANQLCLPKQQEVKAQEENLSSVVTEIYRSKIPVEILQMYHDNPKWFKTLSSIKLNTLGFNYEFFGMMESLPDNNSMYYMPITPEEAEKIHQQDDLLKQLKKDYETLTKEIKIAVFNLRTYNNVEKEFPEAFKLLPTRQTTALIVNLKDIRCKLDKANC